MPTTAGWSVGAPPATMTWASTVQRTIDQTSAAFVSDQVSVQDDVTTALSFVAPTTGTYQFATARSAASATNYDTVLGVYNAAGSLLAGNDDTAGTLYSAVTVNLQAGQRVNVAVGRYLGGQAPTTTAKLCRLTIQGPGDDRFEAQGGDTAATAVPLGTVRGEVAVNGLVMRDRGDYFSFSLDEVARANDFARLDFSHAAGDLDVQLLDAAGTVVGRSDGVTDTETLSLAGLAAGTYRVRVYGYNGATNPSYSLTLMHELAPVVEGPTLGQQAIDWLVARMGQQVGDGDCADMVSHALDAVGAVPFWQLGPSGNDADYVWGTLVTEFRVGDNLALLAAVQPGDVIQYRDYTNADGSFAPHHTSIVLSNDGNGQLTILEQNWNNQMFVQQHSLDLSGMTAGVLRIYRPIAR